MSIGGLNKNRRTTEGRKFCAKCGKRFESNEYKITSDFEHFYCNKCEDTKK
jgi:hypothetical protein